MSARRIVAACLSAFLFISPIVTITSCSSQTSTIDANAISGENAQLIDGLTVNLAESWAPNGEVTSTNATYGNSFGVITAQRFDMSNERSCEECFNNYLDGVANNAQIERDKIETLNTFGDAMAYRVPISATSEGLTARGHMLCVMSGSSFYALMVGIRDGVATDVDTSLQVTDSARITPLEKPVIPLTANAVTGLTAEQDAMLKEVKLIEPVEIHDESNSSYNVYVGTLQNKSNKTHYFIKVKGEFKDDNDNTIDTDWTYACGDEGLSPGESTKFTLSVKRDSRITGIRCYTYDFK